MQGIELQIDRLAEKYSKEYEVEAGSSDIYDIRSIIKDCVYDLLHEVANNNNENCISKMIELNIEERFRRGEENGAKTLHKIS